MVTTQSKELEELEARLRATEERLKQAAATRPGATATGQREGSQSEAQTTSGQRNQSNTPAAAIRQVPPSGSRVMPGPANVSALRSSVGASPIADRSPTPLDPSRTSAMPGAMPETPGSVKDGKDYYSSRRS